uniref:Calcium/proton exchanger n=1 Tax=Tanacetum cinerariifolium TaxID=118510 RepID=A0A699JHL2_TANCI|nr:calcium/proton exchanger [Tanacetum cinerariifolium]
MGKQRAVYDHEGGLIDHYAKLWDYRDRILATNPGSLVQLNVDTMEDGKTHFKRIYERWMERIMQNGHWTG